MTCSHELVVAYDALTSLSCEHPLRYCCAVMSASDHFPLVAHLNSRNFAVCVDFVVDVPHVVLYVMLDLLYDDFIRDVVVVYDPVIILLQYMSLSLVFMVVMLPLLTNSLTDVYPLGHDSTLPWTYPEPGDVMDNILW